MLWWKLLRQFVEFYFLTPSFAVLTCVRHIIFGRHWYGHQVSADTRRITVLLHGLGANDAEFAFMRLWLAEAISFNYARDARGHLHYFTIPSLAYSIEDALVEVKDSLMRIYEATGVTEFDLVGHSLGGVLAMIIAESDWGEITGLSVRRVVTINAPLCGSPLCDYFVNARLTHYAIDRELVPGSSDEIEDAYTEAHESIASGQRSYLCVTGAADLAVPPHFGVIENAEKLETGHAHYACLVDPWVLFAIRRFLS